MVFIKDYEEDNQVASCFCWVLGNAVYDAKPFCAEGGAIHSDGQGTFLWLKVAFWALDAISSRGNRKHLIRVPWRWKVIWLPYGIYQDRKPMNTLSNVAAFVGPAELRLGLDRWSKMIPNVPCLADLELLEKETRCKGRHFTISASQQLHQVVTERIYQATSMKEGEEGVMQNVLQLLMSISILPTSLSWFPSLRMSMTKWPRYPQQSVFRPWNW